MPRSAKYKGDVEVTGDVGIGGEVFIQDVPILERLTQMQTEIDILKGRLARLENAS